MTDLSGAAIAPPPSFEEARSRRQRARAAGLDPNYWYAVEESSALKAGDVMETHFLGRSIAVFRGEDGRARAINNRCAHRSVKLTEGIVRGDRLVCPYHGWAYDGEGNAKIDHELFGKKHPKLCIPKIPVKERYGLIFIFPGDPERATQRDIPSIPELEGERPWPYVFVKFDSPGHHSMLLDNVSDFTHGFLHRKFKPFEGMNLIRLEEIGDRVELEYESKIAAGFWQDMFINRSESDCDRMTACYDYPYHWSNTDGRIKHFLFTLPVSDDSNRHIFIFYLSPDIVQLPGVNLTLPLGLSRFALKMAHRFILKPLLGQDVWVLGHEQEAWEKFWDRPAPEINPVVNAFQALTIRKWREYLDTHAEVNV